MKIIYAPDFLPARCNQCKTIFVPDKVGEFVYALNSVMSICPNCSEYCDADPVDDPQMGVWGKDWLDVRETPPSNGDIIIAMNPHVNYVDVVVAKAIFDDTDSEPENQWIALPIYNEDTNISITPFTFVDYKKL